MPISLSPSNADRWTVCTASPKLIEDNEHRIVKQDREYAKEGNVAHDYASKWLTSGKPHFEAEHKYMIPFIRDYVQFIEARKLPGDDHLVEQKFPLWYMPRRNGYIDSLLVNQKRIRVTDFKFGEGKAVFASNNKQLATYGRTAVELLTAGGIHSFPDSTPVFLDIVQPRCRSGMPESTWELTLGELIEWTDTNIASIARSIIAGEPTKFHASDDDVCRWCDAVLFCEARGAYIFQTEALDVFDVITDEEVGEDPFVEPSMLDPQTLGRLLTVKPALIGWLNKLEEYAKAALEVGKADLIPGWKLAEGKRGHRGWNNEAEAQEILGMLLDSSLLYSEPKFVSPSQAETLLKGKAGREAIAPYVQLGAVGKVLVPDTDPRDSVTVDPSIEFSNLDADDDFSTLL